MLREDAYEFDDVDNYRGDEKFDYKKDYEVNEGFDNNACGSDDKEFDPQKIYEDGEGCGDICFDSNNGEADPKKVYGDGERFNDISFDYLHKAYEEFKNMRFRGANKKNQRSFPLVFIWGN